ncbi:MAG TPA: peptidoglycan binding domain-containing protein, partial [Thermomicrobiales bacterium]|nr:peptidoglycan binding domain-containing protein [Thermomicrobiales bacterium]
MARPFPRGVLSVVAAPELELPLPRMRSWPGTALRRARAYVLPDPDTEPPTPGHSDTHLQHGRRRARILTRRILTAVILTLLVLVIGLVSFRFVYADRVYPAVVVGDVPVGGLTISEAQARLQERAAVLEHGTITFSFEGRTWTPTLSELGVTLDLDASMAAAQRLGRDDNPTARLSFVGDILDADQVVPLQSEVDLATLNSWFDSVDRDMDTLPVDAGIAIEGTTATIVPGATGTVIDRTAATALVLDALSSLDRTEIELPTRVAHPAISTESLEPVRARVA